jgi:DNA polymerase
MMGRNVRVTQERGKFIPMDLREVFITIHPSAILRLRESGEREAEYKRFVAEMKLVQRKLIQLKGR